MGQLTDWNGKLFRVMSRVGDLIVLNLLMLFCSLPIFTLGAAVTAVYDMSLRLIREEEGYLIRGFFRAFRSNWKQATKLWLICLAVLTVSVGDLLVRRYLPQFRLILTAAAGIQMVLLMVVMLYVFPLQARYENTLLRTLSNGILLAICHLPETILMLLMSSSLFLLLFFVPLPAKLFPCLVTLCLLLWFAGVIYLNSMLVSRIFQTQFGSESAAASSQEDLSQEQLMQAMYALDGVKRKV